MMNHESVAREFFLSGFNCAQSVIAAFSPEMGIDKAQALKCATGLGAGINYGGRMCGAVLGAHIILGLKYGTDLPTNLKAKQELRDMLDSFTKKFIEEFGSIECKELLKAEISNPEVLARLRSENVFHTFCVKLVEKAVTITEEMISKDI